MARHVLEADGLAGRELPSFYAIDYRVLPNLGGDLVMPLLLLVLEPPAASKLFLTLAVLVYWLGPTLYILQANNFRPHALWAALLLLPWSFSSQFFWGFLNYYSGLGLAFLLLTHGVRMHRRQSVRGWEWLVHAALVALLFLWHLAAWGMYGVLMGSHVIADLVTRYRGGSTMGVLAKGVVAFGAVCLPSMVLAAIYVSEKTGDGVGATDWGTVVRKLYMPLTLFRGYDYRADGVAAAAWLAAALFMFAGRRRDPGETPQGATPQVSFAAPWIGFILLTALYVAIPFQLGGTSDTDSRLLPAMLVCALAWLGSQPLRRVGLGLTFLAICFVIRQGSIIRAWHEHSRRLDVHAKAFDHLKLNSRVLPLVLVPQSKDYPEIHFPCWAVVEHRAFVPTLFAFRDQQPLRIVPPVPVATTRTDAGWQLDEPLVRQLYDFVWIYNPDNATVLVPASFELTFAADGLELWRVR
ncbi:MAG: hypothetical protein L0Y71_05175 [Gemmataceae bacterium]|nr:hypothetical protein [Gemmataceae bacterium]